MRVLSLIAAFALAAGLAWGSQAYMAHGQRQLEKKAAWLTQGGDAKRGRTAIKAHGCPACHTIPGVPGATAKVGPDLTGVAQRVYIAGVLENSPQNMMRWILDPQAVDAMTAMPTTGLDEQEARDVAAYLLTLQ